MRVVRFMHECWSGPPRGASSAANVHLAPRVNRLLLVSNRLPLTFASTPEGVEVKRSTGGLATGLVGPHQRSNGLWVGWPGDVSRLSAPPRAALDARLAAVTMVPVDWSPVV